VARRRARRKGRLFTHGTSWLGAVVASSIAVLLALGVLVAVTPRHTFRAMREAAASAQTQDARLPEWMTRAFPQAAHPDPVAQKVVNSPVFTLYVGMVGLVLGCAFLGTMAGSAGWVGATLLRYALSGRRAA
jgi:hypothetical protein